VEGIVLIGGLIVSHGRLAHELLSAAQTIEGPLEFIEAVALDWNDSVEDAREKIRLGLERISVNGDGAIIFTDMFGGTPSNISISFLEANRIEVVTGVNLPMIVKFGALRQNATGVGELAHTIGDKGSKAIRVASDLLAKNESKGAAV
jgi:PTS system mannose-specific IIA component